MRAGIFLLATKLKHNRSELKRCSNINAFEMYNLSVLIVCGPDSVTRLKMISYR
jgi:hypothetical protein